MTNFTACRSDGGLPFWTKCVKDACLFSAPKSEAILVPKDSPIQNVAQLKGKKVVLNKGSNVHYLLV